MLGLKAYATTPGPIFLLIKNTALWWDAGAFLSPLWPMGKYKGKQKVPKIYSQSKASMYHQVRL